MEPDTGVALTGRPYLGEKILFHLMVLLCFGQKGYSAGPGRLLKNPGKITERSCKPTVAALKMFYRDLCCPEKVLGATDWEKIENHWSSKRMF